MPFTFAHPAAILPLRRSRFLQTVPLIIGSMVPDAPYFFPWGVAKYFYETHTLIRLFWWTCRWGWPFSWPLCF